MIPLSLLCKLYEADIVTVVVPALTVEGDIELIVMLSIPTGASELSPLPHPNAIKTIINIAVVENSVQGFK